MNDVAITPMFRTLILHRNPTDSTDRDSLSKMLNDLFKAFFERAVSAIIPLDCSWIPTYVENEIENYEQMCRLICEKSDFVFVFQDTNDTDYLLEFVRHAHSRGIPIFYAVNREYICEEIVGYSKVWCEWWDGVGGLVSDIGSIDYSKLRK